MKHPTILERPLLESNWSRATHETGKVWKSFYFWLAEVGCAVIAAIYINRVPNNVVSAALKGTVESEELQTVATTIGAIGLLLSGLLIVLISHLVTTPYKQRNEARNFVAQLGSRPELEEVRLRLSEFSLPGLAVEAALVAIQKGVKSEFSAWSAYNCIYEDPRNATVSRELEWERVEAIRALLDHLCKEGLVWLIQGDGAGHSMLKPEQRYQWSPDAINLCEFITLRASHTS